MTLHRFSLALVAVLAAVVPVAAGSPAAAADISFDCFPHAPAELRYDDTFGAARSGGRSHKGTDILSPKETPVLAVADGEVVGLENGSSSGYYIRLVHDGGWETYYMHLNNDTPGTDDGRGGPQAAFVEGLEVGDQVQAGEVIGYVGDSGNAEGTSSHTHFELHIGGSAVNSYSYLVDVEERVNVVTRQIAHMAVMTDQRIEKARKAGLWDDLVDNPAVDCLSGSLKDSFQHVFGEPTRERLLLARVTAD